MARKIGARVYALPEDLDEEGVSPRGVSQKSTQTSLRGSAHGAPRMQRTIQAIAKS